MLQGHLKGLILRIKTSAKKETLLTAEHHFLLNCIGNAALFPGRHNFYVWNLHYCILYPQGYLTIWFCISLVILMLQSNCYSKYCTVAYCLADIDFFPWSAKKKKKQTTKFMSAEFYKCFIPGILYHWEIIDWRVNCVNLDEMAHYEPSHLDLHCLQILPFLILAVYVLDFMPAAIIDYH